MSLDKYSRLKIACNIFDISIKDFCEQNNVSPLWLRKVCDGEGVSAPLMDSVNEFIMEADKEYQQHRDNNVEFLTNRC